ncbi:DHHA1 domain-containing protein, partial [Patescibacteria group bacterium]
INAAGRMNHANAALHLLIEEDETRATELAQELQQTNTERQKASEEMFKEALEQVGDPGEEKLIVVVKEGWPVGLVGLVAGKLCSKFSRPVFVVGKKGKEFVGSGRSVEGFNVTQALHAAEKYLDRFGGHPQACGFSTSEQDRFDQAVVLMKQFAKDNIKDEDLLPLIKIDSVLSPDLVDWDLYHQLQKFAPFGQANPHPLFVKKGLQANQINTVGADQKHLKLTVRTDSGKMIRTIGFNFGAWAEQLAVGDFVDLVYEVGVNEWNGNRELQFKIVDLKKTQE